MVFSNRTGANGALALMLREFAGSGTVVLGLPRGGVPIAAQVAAALGVLLDVRDDDVSIAAKDVSLGGNMFVSEKPIGMVIFVNGSGSSRHSPRNRSVAGVLNRDSLGILLFDLLTPNEEVERAKVFEYRAPRRTVPGGHNRGAPPTGGDRTADRLLRGEHRCGRRPVGGGRPPDDVAAVVSRGGRPGGGPR